MTIMPVNPQGSGFKRAGVYMDPFAVIQSPEYQKASDADKQFLREAFSQQQKGIDPSADRLVDWAISQSTPEARQKILEQQLAFDKARGQEMQRYRMTNDIIANLGQAARAAGGGYGLTPDYLGQSYANVGNAYLAGLQAMPRVAPQVGQKYF